MHDTVARLIEHWKVDPRSTYNTWFLWEERLKNFRSIRRGIGQVVRDIEGSTFGNAYRGSSLETSSASKTRRDVRISNALCVKLSIPSNAST